MVRAQGERGVSLAFIVAGLDFEHAGREPFDHGSHLAYSIWPDRVREVCKTDRSIAIAHGLEELCEVQAKPTKKKWSRKQREEVEKPVGE